MTQLWQGEPIAVTLSAKGQPVQFTWQGRSHSVARIWQRWQVDLDWWTAEGPVHCLYWAVATEKGLVCVLYCDLLTGKWYLEQVYD